MRLSDGTILMHGTAPYDPVKAHEYYIQNRELTGRKKGSSVPPTSGHPRPSGSPTYTVAIGNKKVVLTQQQLAEQQAFAAKRVGEITKRLAELGTKLKKMMAEAKKKGEPTAADKAKAARESKQYRQSHKQSLATKAKRARTKAAGTKKTDSVAELKNKINKVKGSLKAAIETQRALATAAKNVK